MILRASKARARGLMFVEPPSPFRSVSKKETLRLVEKMGVFPMSKVFLTWVCFSGDFLFLALLKHLLGIIFYFFLGFLSKSKLMFERPCIVVVAVGTHGG